MAATDKRCYYEVLDLPQSCTPDEIRSAYKKLALQRHPDKLMQSGVSSADATAAFQELVRAYEVLSDPKERSWYDSHRSQILFSSPSGSNSDSPFPDLFSYFSPSCYTDYNDPKTGFYKVYGDVFDKIYAHEIKFSKLMGLRLGLVKEAPLLGDLRCDYSQVNAFYGYWLGFCTVMDFGWVDEYDAAAGANRKSRRVMEEENKKLRKKAKREFNETVRGLAEFVKKRDKRVIDMMVRKEKEREKKREEELARKKEREREKLERARLYEEPDWAKVKEVEVIEEEEENEEEDRKEFYCAACGKKFKSDKQWRNHEQSKKHKEKVAQLRKSFVEEDGFEDVEEVDVDDEVQQEDETVERVERNTEDQKNEAHDGFVSAEDDVDDLEENFKESVGLEEGRSRYEFLSDDEDGSVNDEEPNGIEDSEENPKESVGLEDGRSRYELPSDDEDGIGNDKDPNEVEQSTRESDDESNILEAMISGRRNKKHVTFKNESLESNNAEREDNLEPMEYNNKKGKKKSRRAKKEKGNVSHAETTRAGDGDIDVQVEENNGLNTSDTANNGDDDQADNIEASSKAVKQSFGKKDKGTSKRDTEAKQKNSSKGRKQKGSSKNRDPVCEKCGEEFESRSKLHKHLSETGHASLKSR
ncbi:DNAJ protein JJJ1 homolog [Beta vulgaris subsp. vulgaris]|uniref:DNAJ protein JJJ1 homolog n=1 Tax=Beta vulgaris subsp. vulgaris TaxID=3555 RepID=UPI002546952D|nr:DNAJ protein JJJ1 homolog [Beta vulgaris subsp. vulgaris]